jgi:hypothetical protein
MSTATTYGGVSLKKLSIAIAIATVTLLVAGSIYFLGIQNAGAVAPSDYGLKEGNTVSASGSSDPDVYIINDWGYKRLFLNPVIFSFYGHLGGFAAVKNVSPSVRDAFGTSGLFRLVNDQKVWAFESTGEDTGVMHWVNVSGSDAVAQDANFFKKVFVINQAEYNWYQKSSAAYTALNQVPVYTRAAVSGSPVVTGPVSVMLAYDNPGAQTLTTKANGVTYMKLALSGSGTVNTLRVVRQGPGSTSDFSNVYIYDGARRLTTGRSLSSSDGSATFNLNYQVNGSAVLSVVADMVSTGATAGNVNYFSVGATDVVLAGAVTAGGSFPLHSSNFTVSGQVGGTITVDKSGSLTNPNVGQAGAEVAEFKLTANTEGAKISRIQLINGGSIAVASLTNFKMTVNGQTVATASGQNSQGYVVFDMSSNPYVIAKGDNRIFQVRADVAGKKAETIDLYIEATADVLALGDQFGFGMSVVDGTAYTVGSSTTGPTTLTLQGGVLTLSFVGPTATNVTTSQTKVHLLDYNMSAASNLDIRKTAIVLCADETGNGYSAADDPAVASLAAGFTDLNNVAIINRDTGTTLVGPVDGTAFLTKSSALTGGAATDCGTGAAGYSKLFTDSFSMTAGQTLHLAIVADVKQGNTGVGASFATGSQFKALAFGYGNLVSTGDLTVLKYSDSNTGPASTDVIPSGNIGGNNMTVQGSSLALALAANPTGGRNFVKGTNNVNVTGLSFTANQGNPVTVTSLTLQGYAGADNTAAVTTGNPGALISAIRIIDGDTGAVISSTPSANNLSVTSGTSSGKVTFSNLNWLIPGGATKTLVAQVDLSTNTPPTADTMSFDLNETTDVTAIDSSSNTVNAANADVNISSTTSTTYIAVTAAGTLAVTAAADTPTSAPLYWNQQSAPFTKLHFTSNNEAFSIERLNLVGTAASVANNVDNVTVKYLNKAGQEMITTGTFNSAGSVSLGFDGVNRPYVPKDGSMDVLVTGNIKSAASLFRASGTAFSINMSTTGIADEFRAIGEGSGTELTGASAGLTSGVTGNSMTVYRSYPQFTMLTAPATTIAVGQDVFKFRIDAMGSAADGATVFFNGSVITTAGGRASGSMLFAVIASGESGGNALGFDLRRVVDSSGASVDQLVASASGVVSPNNLNSLTGSSTGNVGSASFRFQDVPGSQSVEIPAGSSNTFVLRLNTVTLYAKPANTTTGRTADFLQVIMKNSVDGLVQWTDNGGANRNNSNASTANLLKNLPMNGTRINFN